MRTRRRLESAAKAADGLAGLVDDITVDRGRLRGRRLLGGQRADDEQPHEYGGSQASDSLSQRHTYLMTPIVRSQFFSSVGHSLSAGSIMPSPTPCGPSRNTCSSDGTPALRSAR